MLTEEGVQQLDSLFNSISGVLDQKKFEAMREDIILCAFDAFFDQIEDKGVDHTKAWRRGDPSKEAKWLQGHFFLTILPIPTQDELLVTFHLFYSVWKEAKKGWWELSLCDKESGICRNSRDEPRIRQLAEKLFGVTS